ncbi:MAG TPA: hypothetical protein VF973_03255, partial [Myxococcales bacterium]
MTLYGSDALDRLVAVAKWEEGVAAGGNSSQPSGTLRLGRSELGIQPDRLLQQSDRRRHIGLVFLSSTDFGPEVMVICFGIPYHSLRHEAGLSVQPKDERRVNAAG